MPTKTESNSDSDVKAAYNSALLSGWIATRLEGDKSKLGLSAGGIGLLVTLMTTAQTLSLLQFVLYMAAITFFILTVACVLVIFSRNATHVKEVLACKVTTDRVLKALDTTSSAFFLIAIVLSMSIGVIHGLGSVKISQETAMSNEDKRLTDFEKRSLSGIAELRPTDEQPASGEATVEQTNEASEVSESSDKE